MKFDKEEIKDKQRLLKVKDKDVKKLSIDDREKRVTMMEYIALGMLIIGCIMAIVGAKFMDTIYKSYSMITTSTVYNGMLLKDKENDTLEDTQKLMNEIENLYEELYVNEIERENIDEYVLNSLINAYGDKYAAYRDPSETISNYNAKTSHISGVGILCHTEFDDDYLDDYGIYLIDVYDGSPAEKAGLEIGDKIVAVNGKKLSISKYNFSEANSDIRGDIGTDVDITYLDASDNNKEKTVTITRKNANVNTIRYHAINDEIGYIVIRSFEESTAKEFDEAIKYFTNHGIHKFIFDLRDNGGGLAETCITMLDELLPNGVIVTQFDKNGNEIETSYSDENCVDFTSVCIINESTASAAEMFVKSLVDWGYTKTIGSTSFGKGTICTTFNLSNGGSVTMSTGKFLTKSMEDIEKVGIKPDVEMRLDRKKQEISYKLTDDEDDLIQKAIDMLQ